MASRFDHEDEETETEALVYSTRTERVDAKRLVENGNQQHRSTLRIACAIVVAVVTTFVCIRTALSFSGQDIQNLRHKITISTDTEAESEHLGPQFPSFSCPALVREAKNFDQSFEEVYTNISEHIIESNITAYVESFREEEYDGWGKTYEQVKAGLHEWKIKQFTNNLHDGASIYESASGIGLSILLTLEAVAEVKPLQNIKVYGNEYIKESVYLANKLLPAVLPLVNATLGGICQGDSTDLSFVTSNAFDLVFTGYISTLLDPLKFGKGDLDSNYELYEKICENKKNDWEAKKLAEIAQQRQEDWFALWVQEMIRIAKPGAAIIIEQIAKPYCNDIDDWGGVPHNYWETGIEKYGWDVDKDSLAMARDKIFKKRYNVFMRKNQPGR